MSTQTLRAVPRPREFGCLAEPIQPEKTSADRSASCGRLAGYHHGWCYKCGHRSASLIDATGVLVAILRMHAAELRLQVRYTQVEQIKVGNHLEVQGRWHPMIPKSFGEIEPHHIPTMLRYKKKEAKDRSLPNLIQPAEGILQMALPVVLWWCATRHVLRPQRGRVAPHPLSKGCSAREDQGHPVAFGTACRALRETWLGNPLEMKLLMGGSSN